MLRCIRNMNLIVDKNSQKGHRSFLLLNKDKRRESNNSNHLEDIQKGIHILIHEDTVQVFIS